MLTPAGELYLVSERARYRVESGAAVASLLEAVDGKRNLAELEQALSGPFPPGAVARMARELGRAGVLSRDPGGDDPARTAFFDALQVGAPSGTPVVVRWSSTFDADAGPVELLASLESCGFRAASSGPTCVFVCDDYASAATVREVRALVADGVRCFLVKPTGTLAWMGPLVGPSPGGACIDCLRLSIRRQQSVECYLEQRGVSAVPSQGQVQASVRTALSMAVLQLCRALAEQVPASRLATFDFRSLESSVHAVRRQHDCPTCGDVARGHESSTPRVVLRSRKLGGSRDGGYRVHSAEETLQRLLPLVSSVLGPISYVTPASRADDVAPVFLSGFSVCPAEAGPHVGFDRVCAGKGRGRAQAQVSALAEAIERRCSVYQGDERVRRATRAELVGRACGPEELLLFSERQWATGDASAGSAPPAVRVPRRASADTELLWTEGWSLTRRQACHVPLAYCYADAPAEGGSDYVVYSSNGTAAGSCLEEALLQGLLELVERDAVALWWYAGARRPPAPGADGLREELSRSYARAGWVVELLDLTHDLGVPVAAAVAHEPNAGRFALGFGCHLDRQIAAERALTELNQVFDPEGRRRAPWQDMRHRGFMRATPGATASPARSIDGDDLCEILTACVAALAARGLEVIVVDKTRRGLELSVAQVIVPGLRHPWPRFGGGRLYDVPRRLGWAPTHYDGVPINPEPLLI